MRGIPTPRLRARASPVRIRNTPDGAQPRPNPCERPPRVLPAARALARRRRRTRVTGAVLARRTRSFHGRTTENNDADDKRRSSTDSASERGERCARARRQRSRSPSVATPPAAVVGPVQRFTDLWPVDNYRRESWSVPATSLSARAAHNPPRARTNATDRPWPAPQLRYTMQPPPPPLFASHPAATGTLLSYRFPSPTADAHPLPRHPPRLDRRLRRVCPASRVYTVPRRDTYGPSCKRRFAVNGFPLLFHVHSWTTPPCSCTRTAISDRTWTWRRPYRNNRRTLTGFKTSE